MQAITVHLFGKFVATFGDRDLDGLDGRKAQELFCYLLLHRDHPHPRDTLAGLLWGESSTAQARANLRKTLWQLQVALGADRVGAEQILLADAGWVRINPVADLWLDVAIFDQTSLMVRGRQGATLTLDTALALQTAIELYRGELLDGWFQDWCLFERERLQNVYLTLVNKLIDYHEAACAYERGIALGMDALRYDHAREEVHRRLMRLYYLAGDRTAALRQYERCAAVLHEALGVPPADLTTLLYYQIKSGKLELVEAELESPTAASGTLRALLDNLCQIQAALSELHWRVQQNIREVEVALREQQ